MIDSSFPHEHGPELEESLNLISLTSYSKSCRFLLCAPGSGICYDPRLFHDTPRKPHFSTVFEIGPRFWAMMVTDVPFSETGAAFEKT